MRAHQIMTKPVFTVLPDATILEAANLMLRRHISGLPVVDTAGRLVGIVSEGDFIRRSEIGTQRKRSRLLKLILGPGQAAELDRVCRSYPHLLDDEFREAFHRLERDVAGESVGDHHVDVLVEDVIALDEPQVVHAARTDQFVRILHELVSLGVFFADVEQADARIGDAEHIARDDRPHGGELRELQSGGLCVGAEVEDVRVTAVTRRH